MTALYALVPAAGLGARFNTNQANGMAAGNKAYALLGDRPILHWTVAAFARHPAIDGILVVTGPADVARCRELLSDLPKVLGIVAGGATRQESVLIGLYTLGGTDSDIVLVHDGARPLVSSDIIDRCIEGVRAHGSAVAALPVTDTLKAADENQTVTRTVDRDGLWAIQTPQAFPVSALHQAHLAARMDNFTGTDEASLIEKYGESPVHLVLGSPMNFKITRPEDLRLAESVIARERPSETRIGFGYDIHAFAPGRKLFLGGIEIPDPQGRGLLGHSDADVLLHALCDALLGAAGLPDIGNLYPNTDNAFKDIDSKKLLADVAQRISNEGLQVVNVDMTVIAEAPKIMSYTPRMKQVISRILGITEDRVGIKATTHEGLGALGQGLGIAAHAVASLHSRS